MNPPPDQPENHPPANQPLPVYPPPGMMPPFGYPQPGMMPPPGYPPQGMPGYPPPGYMPPPGMPGYPPGFPPPGMPVYPQGGYVPLMPTVQPVPPAQGSLVQAWVSLAIRPSRENFAAWSQITTRNWIIESLAAGVGIYLLLMGVMLGLIFALNRGIPASGGAVLPAIGIVGTISVVIIGLVAVNYTLQVLTQAFGQALFMSKETYGALKVRFTRALRPIALAQVGITAVFFLLFTIASIIAYLIVSPVMGSVNQSAIASTIFGVVGIFFLFLIPNAIYGIMLQVQAGSVGSGFSRWAVFGINLLSGFALSFVFNIVIQLFSGILRLSLSGH